MLYLKNYEKVHEIMAKMFALEKEIAEIEENKEDLGMIEKLEGPNRKLAIFKEVLKKYVGRTLRLNSNN